MIDNQVVSQGYSFSQHVIVEEIRPNQVVFRVKDALVPVRMKEQ